jgi:hypothetical protein
MVGQVQDHLESIYGIRSEDRADRFLVTEEEAMRLGATGRSNEELLLSEGEDGNLDVALFISPRLLERLALHQGRSPENLLETDLDTYCQVAEGVSHFLYLSHTANENRKVSLLELETQAEIDKFASCILYRWMTGTAAWADELHRRLFDRVSYHSTLLPDERNRYVEANRLSAHYCRKLLPHVVSRRMDRFLSALRYCYRLGAEAKVRHLQSG